MVFLPQGPGQNDRKANSYLNFCLAEKQEYQRLDVAVAWITVSGLGWIEIPLVHFLQRGGIVRIVVGIDSGFTPLTTFERLELYREHGDIEVFVFHDSNPLHTFHPKVYRAYNDEESRLMVGSSNLTDGGMFRNYEASLAAIFPNNAKAIDDYSKWFENLVDKSVLIENIDSVHELRGNPEIRHLIPTVDELATRRQRERELDDDREDDTADEGDRPENPFPRTRRASRPKRNYNFTGVDEEVAEIGAAVEVEAEEDADDGDSHVAIAKCLGGNDAGDKPYFYVSVVTTIPSGILPPYTYTNPNTGENQTDSFTIQYEDTDYPGCYITAETGEHRSEARVNTLGGLNAQWTEGHILVMILIDDGPPPVYEAHTFASGSAGFVLLQGWGVAAGPGGQPTLTQEQYDQLFP